MIDISEFGVPPEKLGFTKFLPSHRCAICQLMECPKAPIVTTEFWMCDECRKVLLEIVAERRADNE